MWKILSQFLGWIFSSPDTPQKPSQSEMSEGDMHSGPHGYSPTTAYPDTEYGDPYWESEER